MTFNVKIKTKRIFLDPSDKENYFDVRAIGFPEVAQLIDANRSLIEPLFDRATGKDKKNPLVDLESLGRDMIISAPAVVSHLISLAADVDDLEQIRAVRQLPLDVQMQALEEIASLTFASVGGAKNFLETAIRMMGQISGLSEEARNLNPQALLNGSTDSSATAAS